MCCVTMEGGKGSAELIGSAGFGTSAIAQDCPSILNNACSVCAIVYTYISMYACTCDSVREY